MTAWKLASHFWQGLKVRDIMKFKGSCLLLIIPILVSCRSGFAPVPIPSPTPTPTEFPASPTPTLQPTATQTMLLTSTPTLLPTPTSTFIPAPISRAYRDRISGTYKLDRGDHDICLLKVVMEPWTASNQEIDFELFCKHGPPNYASGHAMAKVILSENTAVFSPPQLLSGLTCQITFQFENNRVNVTQTGVDVACGFGPGIHADGTYKLINIRPPDLGCMDDQNPCGLSDPLLP